MIQIMSLDLFLYFIFVMFQFDWLCVLCVYAISPISSIYRVDMGFINNYKESQL